MTDNELIKNLKQLKQIKPNQDWVSFSKNQILGQEDTQSKNPSIISVFQTLFQKPAYATITAVMLLIVGMAGLFYLTEKETPVKIAETPEKIVYNEPEIEPEKEIIVVLESLRVEMIQIVKEVEKIEESYQALEVRNDVIPKINKARNFIAEAIKTKPEIKENEINKEINILATNVLIVADGAEEILNNRNKKIAGQLIKDLKTRTLTDIQQEILEKAKQAYQNGDYHIALINAMHVSQLDR